MKFLSRLDDFEHIVIDGSVSGTGLSSLYLKDTATPILRIGNNTGDSFITYDGSELSISSDVDLRLTTPTDQDVFLITSSGNITTTQAGGTFTIGGGLTLEAITGGFLKTDANGVVSVDTTTYIPTTDYNDFVNVTGDTMTGRLTLNQNVTIGGTTPTNGNLVITDGSSTLGIDSNEIHSTNTMYIGTNSGDLILRPDGNTTITNGKLGVGTTTPGYLVEATGTIRATDSSGATGVGGAGLEVRYNTTDGAGSLLAYDRGNSQYKELRLEGSIIAVREAGSEIARFNAGKLGIGTTSPKTQFHINDGGTYNNVDANNRLFIERDDHAYILMSTPDAKDQGIHFHNTTDNAFVGRIAYKHRSTGDSLEFRVGSSSSAVSNFILNADGTARLSQYGAGILKTDASGNVSLDTSTYLTSYTETQTLDDVTTLGSSTDNSISVGGLEIFQNLSAAETIDYPLVISSKDDNNGINQLGGEGVGIKFRIAGNDATDPGNSLVGASIAAIRKSSSDSESDTHLAFFTSQNDEVLDEAMRITSDGTIGIGLTNPTHALDIDGAVRTTAGSLYGLRVHTNSGITASNNYMNFFTSQSNGWAFNANGTGADSDTKVIIKADGKVGIGVTNPGSKLTVSGSAISISNGWTGTHDILFVGGSPNSTGAATQTAARIRSTASAPGGAATGDLLFTVNSGDTFVDALYIEETGNVGIGTTSPTLSPTSYTGALHVENDTYIQARLSSSASGAGLEFIPSSGDHWEIQAQTGNSLIFYNRTDGSYRLVIDGGGNIGVGTTNPAAKMHIGPDALVSGYTTTRTTLAVSDITNGAELILRGQSPRIWFDATSSGNGEIYMDGSSLDILSGTPTSAGSSRFNIDSSGNIQFGAYGAGYLKTDASGNISVDTDTIEDTLQSVTDRGATSSNTIEFTGSANAYVGIQGETDVNLKIGTGAGSEPRMYLFGSANGQSNAGNVFIGTANNTGVVDINGDVYVNNSIIRVSGNNSGTGIIDVDPTYGAYRFYDGSTFRGGLGTGNWASVGASSDIVQYLNSVNYYISNGTTALVKVESGGNVGIGTTNPTTKLYVDAGESTFNRGNSDGAIARFRGKNAEKAVIGTVDSWFASNVGIGNTSPSYKLDVAGALNINANATNGIRFEDDGYFTTLNADAVLRVNQRVEVWGGGSGKQYLDVRDQSGNVKVMLNAEDNSYFAANNVGIGTTSPNNKLDVRRSTSGIVAEFHSTAGTPDEYVDVKLISGNTNSGTYGTILRHQRVGTDGADFAILTNPTLTGTPVERFRITRDGEVGIGTDNPNQLLHTVGGTVKIESDGGNAAGAILELKHANNNTTDVCATINMTNNAGGYAAIEGGTTGANNTGYIAFKTDNAGTQGEAMRIIGNGSVGIGTTTPGEKLDVVGNIKAQYNGNNYSRVGQNSSGGYLQAYSGAVEKVMLRSYGDSFINGGNLGVGTASPATKLHVVGTAETRLRVGSSNASSNVVLELRDENTPTGQGTVITYNNATGETYFNNALSTATTDFHFQSGEYGTANDFFTLSNSGGNAILHLKTTSGDSFITYEDSTNELAVASDGDLRLTTPTDQDVFFISSGGNIDMTQAGGTVDMGGNLVVDGDITGNSNAYITSKVGIGTSTPASILSIKTTSTTADTFQIDAGSVRTHLFGAESSNGVIYLRNSSNSNYVRINAGGDSYFNGGNVGIGATSPQDKLHVAGAVRGDFKLEGGYSSGTTDVAKFTFGYTPRGGDTNNKNIAFISAYNTATDSTSGGYLSIGTRATNGSLSEHIRIAQDGNVGIGTTVPATRLEVSSSGAEGILISKDTATTSNSGRLFFETDTVSEGFSFLNSNGIMTIRSQAQAGATSGNVRVAIDGSGNVGIGTTAPQQALHIKGATNGLMMLEGDNDNGLAGCYYKTEDTDNTMNRTKGFFGFQGNHGYGLGYFTMWLDTVGDNGQVTSSEEKFRWKRNGDFHADGDVIAYSTTTPSDIRLKTDVETIESASEKVSKLRGVEYTWSKGKLAGQREIGLIAQEVEAVVPEVVKEKELPLWDDSGESYKTVDYEKLVALLIESNKEMQEEIKQLKERLDGFTK